MKKQTHLHLRWPFSNYYFKHVWKSNLFNITTAVLNGDKKTPVISVHLLCSARNASWNIISSVWGELEQTNRKEPKAWWDKTCLTSATQKLLMDVFALRTNDHRTLQKCYRDENLRRKMDTMGTIVLPKKNSTNFYLLEGHKSSCFLSKCSFCSFFFAQRKCMVTRGCQAPKTTKMYQ